MPTPNKHNASNQALRAFQRDLPPLWTERPSQWVAYRGDQRIGFASQKYELYQSCLDQGFLRDEFVIFCIEPQETEMNTGPVFD